MLCIKSDKVETTVEVLCILLNHMLSPFKDKCQFIVNTQNVIFHIYEALE